MIAELVPEELHPVAASTLIAIHMAAFLVIQCALLFLVYKGLRRETDRSAWIAFLIVAGEVLVYTANGLQCPLTDLAEDLGAEDGSVTDILLPGWIAMNAAKIFITLLVAGLALHARNLIRPPIQPPGLEDRRQLAPATLMSPIPVTISEFEPAPSSVANSGEIDYA